MTTPTSAPAALITGGTTGIGLATAQILHERGYAVLVTGRNPDTLATARRSLPEDVVVFRADLRSMTDADAVAAELRDRFGRLDLVFLNAGIVLPATLEQLDEDTYDQLFDVNVKGQVFTLQKVLPLLGAGSSVIFNSSAITELAEPGMAIYAATKAAHLALVRMLAVDLAPRGIRVNAVSPGVIETPALGKLGLPAEAVDGMLKKLSARLPATRFGASEDVGRLVNFLASPDASYINGANIVVDGGLSIT